MEALWAYALVSVLLVSLLSFVGVLTLSLTMKRLKSIMIYMVSFSAGALFGDAFLHLIPEAVEGVGFTMQIGLYIIIGIIFSFVVEKVIHWRHCHIPTSKAHIHPLGKMNLVGDAIHNLLDGLIIGASYLASIPVGIATTLAVILHEIPQEIGDFGVLIHSGYSKNKALLFNFFIALFSILGAVVAILLGKMAQSFSLFLVPFAAGSFIYIAGSDLIPELHKEVKWQKSIVQILIFGLGIAVMVGLLFLEF